MDITNCNPKTDPNAAKKRKILGLRKRGLFEPLTLPARAKVGSLVSCDYVGHPRPYHGVLLSQEVQRERPIVTVLFLYPTYHEIISIDLMTGIDSTNNQVQRIYRCSPTTLRQMIESPGYYDEYTMSVRTVSGGQFESNRRGH